MTDNNTELKTSIPENLQKNQKALDKPNKICYNVLVRKSRETLTTAH